MKKLFYLLCFTIFFAGSAKATHIVGGVLSYECQGVNQTAQTITVRLTLKVYRDAINGQAPFDNPAIVGVFVGTNATTPTSTLSLTNPTITTAPIDLSNPCLTVVPGTVGVEEAVYTITTTLPLNPLGYTFTYQRCCRNNTINNLINPGAVGASYTIFMSALAQQVCNDSPVYNNYPPIVICKDQPVVFDHSASDANGNRLEYSLCSPFTGASQISPAPNPPSGPPYGNVPFSAPNTATFPMPANPAISINQATGLLTGTPTQVGQYVVGVCVREYDTAGNLLSTTLRDFQFNVVNCISTIDAIVQSDSISANGIDYFIAQCDNNTLTFVNQSTPAVDIDSFEWRFTFNNGNDTTIVTPNYPGPTITFPGPDVYTGWLVANPGQTGCTDTAFITFEVYPPIFPDFEVLIDSCNPAVPPVQFNDLSTIGGNGLFVEWLWDFGDGTTSNQQNPQHLFPNAGSYLVSLTVTDSNGCSEFISQPVDWYPPAIPAFTVDDPSGCPAHSVVFTHTSQPFLPSVYTTTWDFGDGSTSTTSPTVAHTYPNPGTYDVTLSHESPWGCQSSLTIPNMITVFEPPVADFNYTYDSCVYEAVDFFDATQPNTNGDAIVGWTWDFQDGTTSNQQNPSHLYQFAGTYPVELIAFDMNGCTDTIFDSIEWYPKPVIDVQLAANSGCAPFTVFFDNQSYPINGYSTIWNFGDGNGDTLASPTHTYQNPGIYYVDLVITSPLGCTDTFLDTIEVFETPNANYGFSFDPCVYGPVNFDENSTTNSSGTPLTNWQWVFDDGNTAFVQDTSYQYDTAGHYNVSLIVTDLNNCTDTATQTVSWFPAPIFDVDVSDSVGCEPLTVTFTNNSYPINGYITTWDFGDGGTDTAASPTYTFDQPGTFIVHLNVLSPTNCVGDFYDTIVVHENPTANFSFSFDSCEYTDISFTDLSTTNQAGDNLVNWDWDYDNGYTANVGYSLDTSFLYPPRADYDISLIVTDVNGCRDTFVDSIPYYPAPVFPVNSHSTEECLPVSVVFDNNNFNNYPGYTFDWDFGDGNSSNAFDTTYVYDTEGIYYTSLTIVTATGCTDTYRDTIVANGIPFANYTASYDPCALDPVRFENKTTYTQLGSMDSTLWNFGDGTTGTFNIENHNYNFPSDTGEFTINLTVIDNNGCTDDTTGTLYWRPQPVLPVDLVDSRGCLPHAAPPAVPNPYPADDYRTEWYFGDGRESITAAPSIVYTTPGVYTRKLIVTSPIGCVDSFSSTHTALQVPIAGFDYSPKGEDLHIYNSTVTFSDSSQRANLWQWYMGDGTEIVQRNPVHTYADTGLMVVQQVVTHRNGCKDTATQVLDIVPKISYFLPNAFTPNDDGKNDVFMGKGYFEYISNFEMAIFNRWGECIYMNESPYDSWNGRKFNSGKKCQAGVYVVVVRYNTPRGQRQEIKGFATIVY